MTKQSMIKYITSFELYPTMNSWNQSNGYSINMKVHNLPLRKAEKDKLYDIIGDESLSSEFYQRLSDDIENWKYDRLELFGKHTIKKEKQLNIGTSTATQIKNTRKYWEQNGWNYDRQGTQIMTLWKMVEEPNFDAGFNGRSGGHLVLYKWNGHNFAGTGWNHDKEELEEMSKEDVRWIYKILQAFESLAEALTETAREFASEEVEEIEQEYTVKKTIKRFKNIS